MQQSARFRSFEHRMPAISKSYCNMPCGMPPSVLLNVGGPDLLPHADHRTSTGQMFRQAIALPLILFYCRHVQLGISLCWHPVAAGRAKATMPHTFPSLGPSASPCGWCPVANLRCGKRDRHANVWNAVQQELKPRGGRGGPGRWPGIAGAAFSWSGHTDNICAACDPVTSQIF